MNFSSLMIAQMVLVHRVDTRTSSWPSWWVNKRFLWLYHCWFQCCNPANPQHGSFNPLYIFFKKRLSDVCIQDLISFQKNMEWNSSAGIFNMEFAWSIRLASHQRKTWKNMPLSSVLNANYLYGKCVQLGFWRMQVQILLMMPKANRDSLYLFKI